MNEYCPAARLFVTEARLASGEEIALNHAQAHYLSHVLRLGVGASIAVFNGLNGEFSAEITQTAKKSVRLSVGKQTRPQDEPTPLMLAFAPVKGTRIDFIAQKATELGVTTLQPIITEYTSVRRVNLKKLNANAIEAAEQTGRLTIPEVKEPLALSALLKNWNSAYRLVFCDESLAGDASYAIKEQLASAEPPAAIFIGPEGGFSPSERTALKSIKGSIAVALGKNILRSDTAAVSALSIWQAVAGEWR